MINDNDYMAIAYKNVKNSNPKKRKRGHRAHHANGRGGKYNVGKITWGPNSRIARW